MRYAVFSDIHANLEAFEAVLEVFKNSYIDKYIFVGDVVGYGADPCDCIRKLRELNPVCVAGNHDWACVGLTDIGSFNEPAMLAIKWTKEQLEESDKLFLAEFKLAREEANASIVHGALYDPEDFHYIVNIHEAIKNFNVQRTDICFVGHSHSPGVFIKENENIHYEYSSFFKFSNDKRYIVNVGSIGQPRDGDPRSCFCIYDDKTQELEFKRLVYDVAKAQKKMIDAGLPRFLADRLSSGR